MPAFFLGALAAALLYVACVLLCSGLRAYAVERDWTLASEQGMLDIVPDALTAKSDGAGR